MLLSVLLGSQIEPLLRNFDSAAAELVVVFRAHCHSIFKVVYILAS